MTGRVDGACRQKQLKRDRIQKIRRHWPDDEVRFDKDQSACK
jgi:hypothetical protein